MAKKKTPQQLMGTDLTKKQIKAYMKDPSKNARAAAAMPMKAKA